MATIVKTPSGTWKALIRKNGWPTNIKTFRTKRDAEDWARRTEDEMVRGVHIVRATAERMTLAAVLKRYTAEVTPTKRPSSQESELRRAAILERHLGKYSLAALTPEIIAHFRDMRLANAVRISIATVSASCHPDCRAHAEADRGQFRTRSARIAISTTRIRKHHFG